MPKIELNEIEDFYTWYVDILGVSENTFWNADIHMLYSIVVNKEAFSNWKNYVEEELSEDGPK